MGLFDKEHPGPEPRMARQDVETRVRKTLAWGVLTLIFGSILWAEVQQHGWASVVAALGLVMTVVVAVIVVCE